MLLENVERYKLSTTKAAVTSFAGVPLVWGMAQSLGVAEGFNRLAIKERSSGYTPAEVGMTLLGIIAAGGEALDDVALLRGDEGLRLLIGELPAANTLGEWLRRFKGKSRWALEGLVIETAVAVIRARGLQTVTLDVDAFFCESQKWNAGMNYEGLWGYCPMAITCAELKMPVAGLFRPGEASPMADIAGLLERVVQRLKQQCPGIPIQLRSDSAGYQAGVVRVCQRYGVDFTITARKDEAVRTTIASIPKKAWQRFEDVAWEGRVTEIAETVHAFGDPDLPAYRLIVLRWAKKERELWDVEPYEYHAILVSRETQPAGLVVQFHRNRQDKSENVNKELSQNGVGKWPCRKMRANAAYFQVVLLAHIVTAALKHLVLPEGWQTLTMKTLRFRMIRLAGIVQKRARSLWLKIPQGYAFRSVFEDARYRVMGVACEMG